MWTVDYEEDIASDLSAFHRIDDPMTIDGPRYFSLAKRLPAYRGVMYVRAAALRDEGESPASGARSAAPAPSRPSVIPDDVLLATLAADGQVEHTKEGAE
jgi:hypothetical protein